MELENTLKWETHICLPAIDDGKFVFIETTLYQELSRCGKAAFSLFSYFTFNNSNKTQQQTDLVLFTSNKKRAAIKNDTMPFSLAIQKHVTSQKQMGQFLFSLDIIDFSKKM